MTTPTSTHGERDNGDSPTYSATYAAALEYVSRGWRVVALHWVTESGTCSCVSPTRSACKAAGKHPRDRDWTERPAAPERWSRAWSLENVGILTGWASGFWVLDFDPADAGDIGSAGWELHDRLTGEHGLHPHVRTGGGGYHWRFAMPADGREIRNRQTAGGGRGRTHSLPRGWDVRGDGGQVVAPPSVSAKGEYIELSTREGGAAVAVHPTPAWLLEMVAAPEREAPPDHAVSPVHGSLLAPAPPGGIAAGARGDTVTGAEGPPHPAVRVQAYAVGALQAECSEYSQLMDGRRGEAAAAFARSLVEIANLAGWDTTEGGEVYSWFSNAMLTAAGNAGGGGYAPHEVAGQWERAREHVGGRARVMPAALEVLPDVSHALAQGADLGDFHIVEPGAPSGGHGSTNGYAPSAGVTGQEMVTGAMPAPSGPPPAPPVGISAAGWVQVVRQDAAEEAKRWRAARDGGDVGARLAAMRAEIIDAKALKLRPRLRPIVDGLLYRNTLARINGASGDGKSLVVLDLAARVAAGQTWAGRCTHAGTVVYLVAEGEEGVGGRVEAWERHHASEFPSGVLFLPRPVQVMGDEWPILSATLAELRPVLVIGDTQARMTSGVNEIDNTELGEVVERLDGLRVATGAAVLLVHHYGTRGERGRGGTAITGALQTELGVKRTGSVIEVTNPKSKDDAEMKPALFDLVQVALPDENGIVEPNGRTGAVAVYRGEMVVTEERRESENEKRARSVWKIMHDALGVPGQTFAEIRDAFGESIGWKGSRTGLNSAFTRAWALLIERGLVAYRKQRFKIIEVQNQSADGVLTASPDLATGGVGVLDAAEWQLLTSGIDEKLAEERRKSSRSEKS